MILATSPMRRMFSARSSALQGKWVWRKEHLRRRGPTGAAGWEARLRCAPAPRAPPDTPEAQVVVQPVPDVVTIQHNREVAALAARVM